MVRGRSEERGSERGLGARKPLGGFGDLEWVIPPARDIDLDFRHIIFPNVNNHIWRADCCFHSQTTLANVRSCLLSFTTFLSRNACTHHNSPLHLPAHTSEHRRTTSRRYTSPLPPLCLSSPPWPNNPSTSPKSSSSSSSSSSPRGGTSASHHPPHQHAQPPRDHALTMRKSTK